MLNVVLAYACCTKSFSRSLYSDATSISVAGKIGAGTCPYTSVKSATISSVFLPRFRICDIASSAASPYSSNSSSSQSKSMRECCLMYSNDKYFILFSFCPLRYRQNRAVGLLPPVGRVWVWSQKKRGGQASLPIRPASVPLHLIVLKQTND